MLQTILQKPDVMAYLRLVRQHQDILYAHSVGVTAFALSICQVLGISDTTVYDIGYGAIFHDAGKLEIPASLLNKEGPLDKEERALMKTHPLLGDKYLPDWLSLPSRIIVRQHHEAVDGSGYPEGMQDICRAVQIVVVADKFDAMTHKRSYKEKYSQEYALEFLRDEANLGKYGVDIVDALSKCASMVQLEPLAAIG